MFWHQNKKKRVFRGFACTLWHDDLTWKLQLYLKNREICDVEFHAKSENKIGFRIAFSVLVGNHFEQHAVFMIFGHFSPFLNKIAPPLKGITYIAHINFCVYKLLWRYMCLHINITLLMDCQTNTECFFFCCTLTCQIVA